MQSYPGMKAFTKSSAALVMLALAGPALWSEQARAQTNGVGGVAEQTVTPDVVYSSDSVFGATDGSGFSASGSSFSPYFGAHMRARYNTRSYGQTRGNLDLGTAKFYDFGDTVWFLDGQVTLNDDSGVGYNVGFGARMLAPALMPGSFESQNVVGVSFWSDGAATANDNFISQAGVSLELLGDMWDARYNASIPFTNRAVGEFQETLNVSYSGNYLVQQTIAGVDEPLAVSEFEVARRIDGLEAWVFGGGYALFGEETDTTGGKLGLRGYVTPDLSLQFAVTDDDVFGTNAVFNLTWFIGRSRGPVDALPWTYRRMREPVLRNDYIAMAQSTVTGGTPLLGDLKGDGEEEVVRIVHVDSSAPAGGDGSFENPLNMLSDVEANSTTDSIVLVHADSTFTDDTVVLQDGQFLFGEGGGIERTINTIRFGDIPLPESAEGALNGAIPTITNVSDGMVGGLDVITVSEETCEVSNLAIIGGDRAIVSPNGSADLDINNVDVSGVDGDAIVLTPASVLTDPDDPDSLQVQFTPTITDVTFSNVGGDDINLDATSPEPSSVPVVENIVISNVSSTGGQGTGVNITNNSNTVTITDYTHDGGDASTGGMLFTDADGSVVVTNAEISNEGGFGVRIVNSDATHTFNNVEIEDTGDSAFHVDGGATTVNFTGNITQSEAGTTVLVDGNHTGTLNFFESVADAGVITATNGDGLQFDNADGDYNFLDGVTLNGGDAGIDFLNDTDGTFTFTEASITDPAGVALNVESGASSMTYTGSITQSNDFSTILVQGEHTGTFTFNELNSDEGIINATNGDGLQFNDADGAYTFNDAVVLDGTANMADTGIDILSDSDGTFTFDDATITDPTGTAVNVVGGSSIVTYTGSVTQSNDAAALSVTAEHDGTLTFIGEDADSDVITATNGVGLVFNNADGDYAVLGGLVLDGSGVGADTAIDIVNDSNGVFTFADAMIVDPAGIALNIEGGESQVTYAGTIVQSNDFSAVSVSGEHTGSLTVSEVEADAGTITATNGDGLQFNNADGTYTFNDAVVLNGDDAGIDIINDSEGTFTFADTAITDPTGTAFNLVGGTADVTYTGSITQSNNAPALSVAGEHTGTVTFIGVDADTDVITASNGPGLLFNNADGDYAILGGMVLTGGAAIDISNDSDGAFNFANAMITDPNGVALNIDGGEAEVTYTGLITQSNNFSAVSVSGGHTGSLTMNEVEADQGVINATNGDGLQFDDADGTYTFNDAVVLNGADAGVDIINDSEGTFTFADATITSPTGTAFNVVGGSADVNYTGLITQANNATAVSVTGGHDGTLMFDEATAGDGVVNATNGDGLQFSNADGAYFFNNAVTLNGGDAGIDIVSGSSGLFLFANGSEIINPTGDALVVTGSDADVTYNGEITNNAGRAVLVSGNSGGNVDVGGMITDTAEGIVVQNNTGGDFDFDGGADLDTGANDAVTVDNNTGTTIAFSNLDITTTSGSGFVAADSEGVSVTGTGNTITTTTGVGVDMMNVEVATAGVTFGSVSVDGAANGIVLNNITGGTVTVGSGAVAGDGGVIQNTTGAGVVITNVESASLNFLRVTDTTGDGIELVHNNTTAFDVSINGSIVRNTTTGEGVSLDATGSGVMTFSLNDSTVDNNDNESVLLNIDNDVSVANVTISGNTIANSNNEEAVLLAAGGGNGKTVNLLIQDNTISNDDPTAAGVDLQANGTVTLNTTILRNTFNNGDVVSGEPIRITADDGSANIRLSMFDNVATSGAGGDDYFLFRNAGSFSIENLTVPAVPMDQVPEMTVEEANQGTIFFDGGAGNFTTDPGNVPTP